MSKTRVSNTKKQTNRTNRTRRRSTKVKKINKRISQIIKSLTKINHDLTIFGGNVQSGGGNIIVDIGKMLVNRFVGSNDSDQSVTDRASLNKIKQLAKTSASSLAATAQKGIAATMSGPNKEKHNYVKKNWDKIQQLTDIKYKQPVDDDFSKKKWIYRLTDSKKKLEDLKHGEDYLADVDEVIQRAINNNTSDGNDEDNDLINELKNLISGEKREGEAAESGAETGAESGAETGAESGKTVDNAAISGVETGAEAGKTVGNAAISGADAGKTVDNAAISGADAGVETGVETGADTVEDINAYPVDTLDDALMQLMSRVMNGSGIIFSKLLGQGFLLTLGLLTGSRDEVDQLLNQPNSLEHSDIISSTSMLKRRLSRASEIVGAMATNQHIQNILGELTEKIALFLMKIKVPVTEISSIVIKATVQLIQENSAIMGKGVAKTLWGFINTMITQIPVVGIVWSMMIFVSTAFIYAIQFMNVITSKGAQGAINAAKVVKKYKTGKQSGGSGITVGGGDLDKITDLFAELKYSLGKIVDECGE
jgi:hypothetical protein